MVRHRLHTMVVRGLDSTHLVLISFRQSDMNVLMGDQSNLVWSPTHSFLAGQLDSGEDLRLLISPFMQSGALSALIDRCHTIDSLKVITRWSAHDIASGISDPEVYPLLKARGIPLYLHKSIHLKLMAFSTNWAFVTSSNVTSRGLGLSTQQNLEVGCRAELRQEDWRQLYALLADSVRVDDAMYESAVAYRDANRQTSGTLPPLELAPAHDPAFSTLALPATDNPQTLHKAYAHLSSLPAVDAPAFYHDLALYDLPIGLRADEFYDLLRLAFVSHPFTLAIVALISDEGSARFGLVNQWLQDNCSDRPTPYRWELKPATRRLYDWLEYFYDEISWDRPHHSMVIRWQDRAL